MAMVFGSDAVSAPPAVSLPTTNDYWFTNGNGTSIQGTQAPDYWFNKVGGEIKNVIAGLGVTLDMTNRSQLLGIILAQAAEIAILQAQAVVEVPPVSVQSSQGIAYAPGQTRSLSTPYFVAPMNGYCFVTGSVTQNLSNIGLGVTLSNSLTSQTSSDGNSTGAQAHQFVVKVPKNSGVVFTLAVTNNSTTTPFDATSRLGYVFVPTPQDTSF